jgi:hypothetical protein
MKLKGRDIVFRIDPETSERLIHVDDYHHLDDALRGTELTAWFGRSLPTLFLRMAVLFLVVVSALVGIFWSQFQKYCEAQKLR